MQVGLKRCNDPTQSTSSSAPAYMMQRKGFAINDSYKQNSQGSADVEVKLAPLRRIQETACSCNNKAVITPSYISITYLSTVAASTTIPP